jgi:hypothetical protein
LTSSKLSIWLPRFLLIALLFLVSPLAAQQIVLGNATPVDAGLDGRPLVEPHLAVHPGNPEHLLAAVMVSVPAEELAEIRARITCSALLSLDAGETWERHDFQIRTCYDPWMALLPDGRAVFTAVGAHPSFGELRRLLVFRWTHGYTREPAAFPAEWIRGRKFWPAVARVESAYGDRNLVCSCLPTDAYADANA